MIVLRDADKIHVGGIIAGSVILYQGTFEPVTAALLLLCYLTATLILLLPLFSLIDIPHISSILHRERKKTDIMAELSQLEPVKLISLEGKSCLHLEADGWMDGMVSVWRASYQHKVTRLESRRESVGISFESIQTLIA
jgi:hypothetical protein